MKSQMLGEFLELEEGETKRLFYFYDFIIFIIKLQKYCLVKIVIK